MRISYVDAAGQRLRIAEMGPPDADRTLLLFNGIGASIETAEPFMAAFERTHVLTIDAPGVGKSPVPLVPYRLSRLSRICRVMLDTLHIDKVDVFGVSWGGGLAQQFAHDHQKRCRSLTLAATAAGWVMVPGKLNVMLKLATPRRYSDPEYMMKVGPELYGGILRENRDHLKAHADLLGRPHGRGYLYQIMAVSGWTSYHWLHRIKIPTLIMTGDDDPIVPPINAQILARRLPNATIKSVECGHLFMLTHPKLVAATIEEFISQESPGIEPRESADLRPG
ncbi:MAG: poly(3-hydroxyalkanoate) depolymerase [Hyphomicrobiaceae bacterium]